MKGLNALRQYVPYYVILVQFGKRQVLEQILLQEWFWRIKFVSEAIFGTNSIPGMVFKMKKNVLEEILGIVFFWEAIFLSKFNLKIFFLDTSQFFYNKLCSRKDFLNKFWVRSEFLDKFHSKNDATFRTNFG